MIYEYFRVSLCSWYCSWLRWSIQYYSLQRWCSGIRYAVVRFFNQWARFPQMMRWKVFTHHEYVSLINSTRYWNCMNLKFIKDFEARLSQVEDHGEEKHRSKRLVHETLKPEIKTKTKQEQCNRIAGISAVLKEDPENAFNGKQKDSVQKETIVVSATMGINVENGHQSPPCLQSREQKKDGEQSSRRKSLRGRSPSGKLARMTCRDCIKGKCTRPSCDFWHPPECQNYKKKSGMQIRWSVCFRALAAWRSAQQKTEKSIVTKVLLPCWRIHDNWVA